MVKPARARAPLCLLALLAVLAGPGAAGAEELSYGEMVRAKLASGISNLCLGLAEIPKNIVNTSNEANVLLGMTGGLAKGTLHSVGRMLSGGVDLLTFPIPSQPITHPAFVWQQFNLDTRYGPFFDMNRQAPPAARPAAPRPVPPRGPAL